MYLHELNCLARSQVVFSLLVQVAAMMDVQWEEREKNTVPEFRYMNNFEKKVRNIEM